MERAKANVSVLKLRERYQFHKDEVVNLFKRIKYYSASKKNEIFEILNEIKYIEGVNLLFPEKYCDINNTSLGKLKKDVLAIFTIIIHKLNKLTNTIL